MTNTILTQTQYEIADTIWNNHCGNDTVAVGAITGLPRWFTNRFVQDGNIIMVLLKKALAQYLNATIR